jgi:hypothetical protein
MCASHLQSAHLQDNDWSAWNSALQTGVADVHVFSSPDVGDLKAVAVMLAPPAWGGQHSGWNLQQVRGRGECMH